MPQIYIKELFQADNWLFSLATAEVTQQYVALIAPLIYVLVKQIIMFAIDYFKHRRSSLNSSNLDDDLYMKKNDIQTTTNVQPINKSKNYYDEKNEY